MSASVPWSVSAVDPDTWDAAREAARREGLSVGEWLEAAIRENTRIKQSRERNPAANFEHRLDDLAEQINMMARRNVYVRPNQQPILRDAGTEQITSSIDALGERIDQMLEGMERAQRNNGREEISAAIRKLDSRIESILIDRPSSDQDSEVETKLDEMTRVISQMSERLEKEVATASAAPLQEQIPTADELDAAVAEIMERQSMLDGTPMRRIPTRVAAPAPVQPAHAPQFANLERQLKTIADEMQSLRKSNARGAQEVGPIKDLRRDIAELGRAMAELAPRRTLESLEHTVDALARKVDRATTASPKDNRSAQAVLTALEDIRLALANVRPAESFISVEGDLNALSEKLDVINAKSIDGTTVARIQNQIQEVRDLLSNALPAQNLQAVVAQIETIASKVDRISTPDDSGMRGVIGALEQRIETLAERVELGTHAAQNPEAFDRIHQRLDALQVALDKAENPMGLEETMRSVVERLNASEEKLNNLGAIERGISDLSSQFDKARANAMDVAERAAKTALRELQAARQTMPQQIAAAQQHAVQAPAPLEADPFPVRPLAGEPMPARIVTQSPVPSEPQQRFTRTPPVTVRSTDEFVATDGLPADHPLEPGSGAPRSRSTPVQQRIAQSEAAVADIGPKPSDPNTKTSDFIAAARRAAQAAAAESSNEPDAGEKKKGALSAIFARSRRAMLLGLVVAMLGFSAVRFFDFNLIMPFRGTGEVPASAPKTKNEPAPPANAPTSIPEQQQRSVVPGFDDPTLGSLPPTSGDITPQNVVSMFGHPQLDDTLTTQSTKPPRAAQQTPLQTQNVSNQAVPPKPELAVGINEALLKAANGGDADAAFEIGERYMTGRGVETNTAEALKWFERAVSKGSAPAAFRLGMAYEKGQGVSKDRARARTNYVLAAESGHLKAMHNLAVLMVEDGGAKPNYTNAIPWFRRAAEHGLRDSQYNLGVIYARGFGVTQSLSESFVWFSLAADQGDPDAAKKRDEVASRLDQQTLVAARLAAQTWAPKPANESVNAPRIKPEWRTAATAPKKKQKK